MYYYLYQIRNKINNKIYIGIHKTQNLNDGYMGSGSYLKKAKEKYGIENFEKTILEFFESNEELLKAEADIVTEEFLDRQDVYNLVLGGIQSSFDHINKYGFNLYGANGENGKKNLTNQPNSKTLRDMLVERGTWETYKEKMSRSILKLYEGGFENPFLGKKHSEQVKKRIGEKNSKHQTGTGNSQYGTRWIYNTELKISKKIKKDEVTPDGWFEGRRLKF